MRRSLALLAAALLTAAAAPAAAPADPGTLRAGAASADITGPVGTPQFAYTARSYLFDPDPAGIAQRVLQIIADPDTGLYAKTFEPSVGIHTRTLARALVLEQDGVKYALVQADLGGLPYALTQEVLKRIAGTGIDGAHLILAATHTHSSMGDIWPADNSGYAYVGGDAFDPRVFASVAQGIAEAIRAADARLVAARVGVGTAQIHGASHNREYETYLRNHDLPAGADARRAGSIEPTVTVVRVDAADGAPVAVWSNFAIHPTSFGDGNHLLSGDNAGDAARLVEAAVDRDAARRGIVAPHVVNVWTNAAEGDTAPSGETTKLGDEDVLYAAGDAAQAYLAGARTAEGIVRAWRDAGMQRSATTPIGARRTFLAFDGTSYGGPGGQDEPVGPFPVLGAGVVAETRPSLTDPSKSEPNCAPVDDLAGPGQGQKLPLVGGPGLAPGTVPVSFWRVGRLGLAAYPAEITTTMGRRIRAALTDGAAGGLDHVAIVGLANGYLSYTATPEEYGACSYEGSFTLMGREEGYAWLATGLGLEHALIGGAAQPPSAAEPPQLAFASTASTPVRATPAAGTVVTQPSDAARYGRVTFAWNGGDPQVDAARGRTFVAVQRRSADGWDTVTTDDSYLDTTVHGTGDVWTETLQLARCTPLGTYRFHVTGRAVRGDDATVAPYVVDSAPFTVGPVAMDAGWTGVHGGVASLRPLYPSPGKDALVALPRLAFGARVTVTLRGGRRVRATDRDHDGVYAARVGRARVRAVAVRDGCGNASPRTPVTRR